MTGFELTAPAKLNLFLHILGQRPDGYHDLQTYFQLLDYGDQMQFQPHEHLQLVDNSGIPQEANLVYRAAQRLQEASGCRLGAHIKLDKRLPMGGGIGGGSSNAATCLLALNRLWRLELGLDDLAALGLALGADLPVFIRGQSSLATGIGEQLQPHALPEQHYLVAYGPDNVSTAAIFKHPDLTHRGHEPTIATALAQGHNDCQALACKLYPMINKLIQLLGPEARLTGTGGCVFVACASARQAQNLANRLPSPYQYFIAKGLASSVCHQQLACL